MASLFQSFFLAGFECATHRRRDGVRVDSIASQQHDRFAAQDYAACRDLGLSTIRDGLRWHLIESEPGNHDWSSWLPMLHAAREQRVQVIWDLWHYGMPDWLDIFSEAFVDRIAAFASAAAALHRDTTDAVPFWCPLNEVSFFAAAGGDWGEFHPCAQGRGPELKRQLVRAGVAIVDALRAIDPRAQIIWCEPAMHVLPAGPSPEDIQAAEVRRASQFEALDMLMGHRDPELGGRRDLVDVLGLNFYPHNQFVFEGGSIPLGHHAWRPLSSLMQEYRQRYAKPLMLSETGAENCGRAAWLHYVCGEVEDCLELEIPIEGICWYPVTDYEGWDDGRVCPTGLLSSPDENGRRDIHPRLAREFQRQQAHFSQLIPRA